jgi:hypothetical protein
LIAPALLFQNSLMGIAAYAAVFDFWRLYGPSAAVFWISSLYRAADSHFWIFIRCTVR